ncbi:MaoC/PaaZ C-terminal domain-containing protein [Bacteroides rodentium]|uniref:MaoC/PaaZ C-terminal domain-containing protein n=1 Tax=Bacteroides rodentium TaxID=691816 RepID=UPI00046EFF25|nr:MaoC/PaaZ C-terminal domain-containing protein [Bacteroides rodentium]
MSKTDLFKNMQTVKKQFVVTQDVYVAFQKCSGDMNPLHTDDSFAKEKGFPERVMYGNIINAFVSTLIGMCLPTPDVIIHSQEIQYKSPVFMNDVLTAEMKMNDIFESVNAVELKFSFKNATDKIVSKGKVQIGILA